MSNMRAYQLPQATGVRFPLPQAPGGNRRRDPRGESGQAAV